MTDIKVPASSSSARGAPVRNRIIDTAERLLREGKAEFTMRDLAAEAGVSFATPFNHFGSKATIMHVLSARRIDTMIQRFTGSPPLLDAADRVLLAVSIAAKVMLEEPDVNRAVMGWLGTAGPSHGAVLAHSTSLWAQALGDGEGLIERRWEQAQCYLPEQFAFGFRGVLSFWTAGELPDAALAAQTQEMANTLLLGFSERQPDDRNRRKKR